MIDYSKKLLDEAKKTILVFQSFSGITCPENLFMKWPDVVDSLLNDDPEGYRNHIAHIICIPMSIIAEALVEQLIQYSQGDESELDEVRKIMSKFQSDPLMVKDDLRRICNLKIDRLKKLGVEVHRI